MPLGFFASLGNILAGALSTLQNALVAVLQGAYSLTATVLDAIFGAIGISDFTASMTSFLGTFVTYFMTSISYIDSLIVTFFTFFASTGIFILEWFGGFVTAILSIGSGVVSILTGETVIVDPFAIDVLGTTWDVVAELVATGFIFVLLAVYWFNSIDQCAQNTGQGWMGIFMADINSMISVFSFLLDLAWRIVNTVIDLTMRFINVFL
jgi:hypothetical protein